jgi:predicted nuclease of predicted toxin-antitoxin system
MSMSTDQEILEPARRDSRACVTLDADFHALLATTNAVSPSTLRIRREGLDGKSLARLLLKIWPSIGQAVNEGAMITVAEKAVRIRRLPISKDSST